MYITRMHADFDECDIQERGASGGGERRKRARVVGFLLQSQERRGDGAGVGAGDGGQAGDVPGDDLR